MSVVERTRFARVAAGWLAVACSAFNLGEATAGPGASFARDVAPLLQRHCVACHGVDQAKGRYRLDTFDHLFTPGASGLAPVTPNQPEISELYLRLVAPGAEDRMPQKAEALPPGEIAVIRAWIAAGAEFDGPDRRAPLASFLPRAAGGGAPERYGQPWPVTALAFCPMTGQLISSGCRELLFWEAHSGALLRRVGGMPERIHALAWQPGGQFLAVAGGAPGRAGELLLWDVLGKDGPELLADAPDELFCVAFSPAGERLAVGGADKVVRIFDVKSRALLHRLDQHSDWIRTVAYSADGRWLALASRDRTARVHDARDGIVSAIFRSHQAPVEHLVFAEDGNRVLSAGSDQKVRGWDSVDGGQAKGFARFSQEITGLIAGEASACIALADGQVTQRRLSDGAELCRFSGKGRTISLAWHAGWEWLATGSHEGTIQLWRTGDGALLAEFNGWP